MYGWERRKVLIWSKEDDVNLERGFCCRPQKEDMYVYIILYNLYNIRKWDHRRDKNVSRGVSIFVTACFKLRGGQKTPTLLSLCIFSFFLSFSHIRVENDIAFCLPLLYKMPKSSLAYELRTCAIENDVNPPGSLKLGNYICCFYYIGSGNKIEAAQLRER